MKNLILFFLLFATLQVTYAQHSVVVNPDGTHSIVIDHGSIITVVNPDGTYSVATGTGNPRIIVNPDGSHSSLLKNGTIISIINPYEYHSSSKANKNQKGLNTTRKQPYVIQTGRTQTILNPDGTPAFILYKEKKKRFLRHKKSQRNSK